MHESREVQIADWSHFKAQFTGLNWSTKDKLAGSQRGWGSWGNQKHGYPHRIQIFVKVTPIITALKKKDESDIKPAGRERFVPSLQQWAEARSRLDTAHCCRQMSSQNHRLLIPLAAWRLARGILPLPRCPSRRSAPSSWKPALGRLLSAASPAHSAARCSRHWMQMGCCAAWCPARRGLHLDSRPVEKTERRGWWWSGARSAKPYLG